MKKLISIQYEDLFRSSIVSSIKAAFDPNSLGVIAIRKVPCFDHFRIRLLQEGIKMVHDRRVHELESPETKYKVGFNPGAEKSRYKWSLDKNSYGQTNFTGNIFYDTYDELGLRIENKWPAWQPEYKESFINCGKVMRDVSLRLSPHIDLYLNSLGYKSIFYDAIKKNDLICKGRFLGYFHQDGVDYTKENWATAHRDYSVMTALTEPLIIDEDTQQEVKLEHSGLVITAQNQDHMIERLEPDTMLVQLGEVAEIISGGLLTGTPHQVKHFEGSKRLFRGQFVLFMDPLPNTVLEPVRCPPQFVESSKELLPIAYRWQPGQTFGNYYANTRNSFYDQSSLKDAKLIYFYSTKSSKDTKMEYSFLSNFYQSPFSINGVEYPTIEHYYQSAKFEENPERKHAVLKQTDPLKAKQISNRFQEEDHSLNRNESKWKEWNSIKINVMRDAIKAKFEQNHELKTQLKNTGKAILLEDDPKDAFWGGRVAVSLNLLGKLLMEYRDIGKN